MESKNVLVQEAKLPYKKIGDSVNRIMRGISNLNEVLHWDQIFLSRQVQLFRDDV
jgi:hypothetical protein